jgi:hypothetical protein
LRFFPKGAFNIALLVRRRGIVFPDIQSNAFLPLIPVFSHSEEQRDYLKTGLASPARIIFYVVQILYAAFLPYGQALISPPAADIAPDYREYQ